MNYHLNKLGQLSAIGAACSLAVWIGTSSAKDESSILVNKPAASSEELPLAGPALPPPTNPNEKATAPATVPMVPPLSIPGYTAKQVPLPPQEQPSQPNTAAPKRPFMRPAEPRAPAHGKLVGEESMPVPPGGSAIEPEAGVTVVQPGAEGLRIEPTPRIDYDTDGDSRRMYRSSGSINLVMLTKDPTSDCAYAIPLTIPGCCVGEPSIAAKQGLLGRGIVEYRWPNGFRAIIKFRHVRGDIRVDYEGD